MTHSTQFEALIAARDTFLGYAAHHTEQAKKHLEQGNTQEHENSMRKAKSNSELADKMTSAIQLPNSPVFHRHNTPGTMYKKPYSDYYDLSFNDPETAEQTQYQKLALMAVNLDAYLDSIGCVARAVMTGDVCFNPATHEDHEIIEDLVFDGNDISGMYQSAVDNSDDLQVVRGDFLFRFNVTLGLTPTSMAIQHFQYMKDHEKATAFRNHLDFVSIAAITGFVSDVAKAIEPDVDYAPNLYSLYANRFTPSGLTFFFNRQNEPINPMVNLTTYVYRKCYLTPDEAPPAGRVYNLRTHEDSKGKYYWKNIIATA